MSEISFAAAANWHCVGAGLFRRADLHIVLRFHDQEERRAASFPEQSIAEHQVDVCQTRPIAR